MTSHDEYLIRTGRMKDQDGNPIAIGSLVAYGGSIMRVDSISGGYARLLDSNGKTGASGAQGHQLLLVAK